MGADRDAQPSAVQEVGVLIAGIAERWNQGRARALEELWESTDTVYYVAEEGRTPFVGIAAIRDYWAHSEDFLGAVKVELGEPTIDLLTPELALAYYPMRWCFAAGSNLPMGGSVRVSVLARRGPAGWRLFHYVEAPIAAMTQVRMAQEAQAF